MIGLYLLELHAVLQRAELGALLQPVAHHRLVGELDQFVAHPVVELRVRRAVSTRHKPDRVRKAPWKIAGADLFRVGVAKHDARIIAAQFQA